MLVLLGHVPATQRAASYAASGLFGSGLYGENPRQDWLYDDIMGLQRDRDGRLWGMGSEYSGLRTNRHSGSNRFGDNMFDSILQRGLSAGMGFAYTAVEIFILGLMGLSGKDSPYGSGKVRLNFYLDVDGRSATRLQGEGDILWPLYDNPYTTIYTQVGACFMYGGGYEAILVRSDGYVYGCYVDYDHSVVCLR